MVLLDYECLLRIVVLGFLELGGGGVRGLCVGSRQTWLLARLCHGGDGSGEDAGHQELEQKTTHKVIVRPVTLLSQGGNLLVRRSQNRSKISA
jgi:hypothetical protein